MAWYRCVGGAGGSLKLRTASGRIATFSTNMVEAFKSLKSDINPVQDLHGYSKPWSGGGGKNKLENTSTVATLYGVTFSKNDDGSAKLTGTSTGSGTGTYINFFTLPSGTYIFTDGSTSTNYYMFLMVEGDGTWYKNGMSFTVDGNTRTRIVMYIASGTATNTTLYPMVRLSSVSDASFEPYSNICPISGFSALNVTRTGKNWANIRPYDEWVTLDNRYRVYKNIIPENSLFNMSFTDNDTSVSLSGIYFGFISDDYQSGNPQKYKWIIQNGNVNPNKTNQILQGYLGSIFIYPATEAAYNAIFSRFFVQIEKGSTATAYEPYNGQTATVNFGQTVYGGVADVTGGKVNVNKIGVDLGSLTWSYITSGTVPRFQAPLPTTGKGSVDNAHEADLICSNYANTSWANVTNLLAYNGYIAEVNNGGFITIHDDNYTDAPTFKTAMSGVMIVYELATPIEITTTPENLTALSGQNNVYGDTNGDTEVKYLYRE